VSGPSRYCPSCGHHVAGAAYCAGCGTEQQVAVVPVVPAQPTPAAPKAGPDVVTCPVCGASDAVRRIGSIIDSATSHTVGESLSVPLDSLSAPVYVSSHTAVTSSALAQRFTVPNEPKDQTAAWGFAAFCLGLSILILVSAFGAPGGWLLALLLLVGVPVAATKIYQAKSKIHSRIADHSVATARVRSGFYCARDDVAFRRGEGAVRPGSFVLTNATSVARS
jgi:hypothetical protein